MKKVKMGLLLILATMLLSGCGAKWEPQSTSILVDKKGVITHYMIEDFNQPYYSMDELKGQIESASSAYNQGVGREEATKLNQVTVDDNNMIKVELQYENYQDYFDFNEKFLFVGTVSDGYSKGYEYPAMTGVSKDDSLAGNAQVIEKGDMKIVILEEAMQVRLPGKIAYISDGVKAIDEKTAVNLNEGQKAYIIYE